MPVLDQRQAGRGQETAPATSADPTGAPVTGTPPLPRRDAYTPPEWWQPYMAEFPSWRAWQGASQFWARLPGTMRVCHSDAAESLPRQIRAADVNQ
jgi:hypothetical protein